MIFCFGGSLKTYTKCVRLECVRVGHIDNGIWGPCAPSGRNMHHQAAMCTMVHKGDYIFRKIRMGHTVTINFRYTRIFNTYEKLMAQKVPSYGCE